MAISYVGTVVDATNISSTAYAPLVDGNYLYLTTTAGRLTILDISTPATPVVVGSVSGMTNARGLCKKGNYVYVARTSDIVSVVDVSTPATPTVVGSVTNSVTLDLVTAVVEDPSRPYVYAWGDTGLARLTVLNVTTPATPTIVTSFTVGTTNPPAFARPAFDGRYFYGPAATDSYIIDLLTPSAPSLTATIFSTGGSVVVEGNTTYWTGSHTVEVIDVTTKASPVVLGDYIDFSAGVVRSIRKSGNYVYLFSSTDGNVIEVDVSNPAAMTTTAYGPTGHIGPNAGFLAMSAPYLYVPDPDATAVDVFEITAGVAAWQVGTVAIG